MTISVLSILWPASSVTSNTRVKLQICFVIDGITIDNAKKFGRKESCIEEHLHKHFQTEGHNSFLNEVSVTFIDKTNGKNPKKEKDIVCEH